MVDYTLYRGYTIEHFQDGVAHISWQGEYITTASSGLEEAQKTIDEWLNAK